MKRLAQHTWPRWLVLCVGITLACTPLVARLIWAAIPVGSPMTYSAPDVASAPAVSTNKLRLSDPTGTTGPVLCAMDLGETSPTEVPGCDVMLIRHTADCSTAGTNDLWCRWDGTTYVPSGGDVATFARVDGDGELINPEEVTGSFLLRGAGPPAAGSCPHNKATYSDTTNLGDSYVCYGAGQNWHLIGENDDAILGLVPDTASTVAASGPTNVTVSGGACLQTSGNNTTKTITAELVCGADAQGDLLVRGASTYARLARGTARQTPTYDGTTLVVGSAKSMRYDWGCSDSVTNQTYYLNGGAAHSAACATGESLNTTARMLTRSGVAKNLYCEASGTIGVGNTATYTVRTGSNATATSQTALTCQISGASQVNCSNTATEPAVTAGQFIAIDNTMNAASLNSGVQNCAVEVHYQ